METWKPLTSVTWLAGVAHPTTLYHSVTFALDLERLIYQHFVRV
jgi:hypothetical protein